MQDSAFLDVNRHGVLRVPGPLWLGMAMLARYWVLMLVVTVSARRSHEAVLLLGDGGVPWIWLSLQLPIVLLMVAAGQRTPTGGAWARWLWRKGRVIITLTALLNVAWTAHLLWQSDDWRLWPELLLASFCLIDLAVTLAVWRERLFAQLFAEFPEREPKGQDGRA